MSGKLEELWLPVVGYEDFYEVSDLGRVKSLPRLKKGRSGSRYYTKEKILKQADTKGYKIVCLSKESVTKDFKVHRLVLGAFKTNFHHKPQVNHVDGVKSNNNLNNLEWSTSKENIQHAISSNLRKMVGEDNPSSKLTVFDVMEIKQRIGLGHTVKSIAEDYRVHKSTIERVRNGETWSHVKEITL